jgi:acyl phosphate:glycerol-3-phosphate acyltransferase
MSRAIAGIVVAYLLGSIPFAYLAGRLLKGIDLRKHGSGNLGATNVYRTLGAPAAVVVLLADVAKGAVPVLWFPGVFGATARPQEWALAYGLAAIVGHVRPVFLLWRGGGKGIATAAGVFGSLVPLALLVAVVVFAFALAMTRIMSLSSLTAAAALPVAIAVTKGARGPVFGVSVVVAAFVYWTHRSNIGRLMRGAEPRLGRKPPA